MCLLRLVKLVLGDFLKSYILRSIIIDELDPFVQSNG